MYLIIIIMIGLCGCVIGFELGNVMRTKKEIVTIDNLPYPSKDAVIDRLNQNLQRSIRNVVVLSVSCLLFIYYYSVVTNSLLPTSQAVLDHL